ncbi:hypothetical protein QQZ08_012390 [Neonectria magnoliae]|uniref:BZIP domain-containing protein n=1 Tax=Neonectria magnoliae TaxID=2732573 RepID=A0ABR1H333_9HYPO
MEHNFPTLQNIAHLLPVDARITPPPEKMEVTLSTALSCAPPSESSESVSETAQSSNGATTANSSATKRHRKRPSISRSRSDITHGVFPNNNSVFSPRPCENPYTERAYLSASLQLQSAKAADFMREYSMAEAQHQNLGAGKERRRLRKYLGLLRFKINQAVEQERAILARLGELYVEIQSLENWAWAGGHGPSFADGSLSEAPSVYTAMSPISYDMSTPISPLNATSPEFVPQGYFEGHQQLPDTQLGQQEEPADASMTLDTVMEEGEEPSCNHELSHDYVDDEVVQKTDDADHDSMPWFDAGFRTRRLSLPCIQTAWPET